MKQVIINLSTEKNQPKENEVMKILEEMGIEYQISEPQSLEEYNAEIEEAENEIAKGEFITAEDLKKEARSW